MTVFDLWTPLVAGLADRMTNELQPALDEVNATESGLLSQPQVFPFVPEPARLVQYPALGIQRLPATFADDNGYSYTGHYALGVVVFVTDADQGRLVRQLDGFLRAIATVALEGRSLPGAMGTSLRRIVPGPALDVSGNDEPETWVTWAAVEINVLASG